MSFARASYCFLASKDEAEIVDSKLLRVCDGALLATTHPCRRNKTGERVEYCDRSCVLVHSPVILRFLLVIHFFLKIHPKLAQGICTRARHHHHTTRAQDYCQIQNCNITTQNVPFTLR
jgi:hypothetical protein